jgi:nitrous oxide reductase accessory protein NosL
MKRFTVAVVALSLFAAGCDEKLNPVAPTAGQVSLASQL